MNTQEEIKVTFEEIYPIFLKRKLKELGVIFIVLLYLSISIPLYAFIIGGMSGDINDCSNYDPLDEEKENINIYCSKFDFISNGILGTFVQSAILYIIYCWLRDNWKESEIIAYILKKESLSKGVKK